MASKEQATEQATEQANPRKAAQTMTREQVLELMKDKLATHLTALKLEPDDTAVSFGQVIDDALAYGTERTMVAPLALYHGLRRVRDEYLREDGGALPDGFDKEIEGAFAKVLATRKVEE